MSRFYGQLRYLTTRGPANSGSFAHIPLAITRPYSRAYSPKFYLPRANGVYIPILNFRARTIRTLACRQASLAGGVQGGPRLLCRTVGPLCLPVLRSRGVYETANVTLIDSYKGINYSCVVPLRICFLVQRACFFDSPGIIISDMKTNPLTLAIRHNAVDAYYRTGSYDEAAEYVKKSVRFVKRWVHRHTEGLGMEDLPRSGRPAIPLNSDKAIDVIMSCMLDCLGPAGMSRRLKEKLNISVTRETVRRFVKAYLGRPLRPIKKPRLTVAHKHARLRFSKKWVRKNWDNVVVTDSKYFWLCPRGTGPKVWVPYGSTAPVEAAERNCFKVHAYAGVSKWGRTKLFITVGTTGLKADTKGVTGAVYKEILEKELIPACKELMSRRPGMPGSRSNWVFQQDNAKPHTSKLVKNWLKSQSFEVMEWPAKSPDLSWIENLWGYVSKQLSKRTDLTRENFVCEVMKEWDSIPQHVHNKTYESIKDRLHSCIDNEGGSTKY